MSEHSMWQVCTSGSAEWYGTWTRTVAGPASSAAVHDRGGVWSRRASRMAVVWRDGDEVRRPVGAAGVVVLRSSHGRELRWGSVILTRRGRAAVVGRGCVRIAGSSWNLTTLRVVSDGVVAEPHPGSCRDFTSLVGIECRCSVPSLGSLKIFSGVSTFRASWTIPQPKLRVDLAQQRIYPELGSKPFIEQWTLLGV